MHAQSASLTPLPTCFLHGAHFTTTQYNAIYATRYKSVCACICVSVNSCKRICRSQKLGESRYTACCELANSIEKTLVDTKFPSLSTHSQLQSISDVNHHISRDKYFANILTAGLIYATRVPRFQVYTETNPGWKYLLLPGTNFHALSLFQPFTFFCVYSKYIVYVHIY